MKQIGLALHNYISSNDTVPPSGNAGDQNNPTKPNVQNGSMKSRILPYMEQQQVYNAINWSLPQLWDGGLGLPGNVVNATATTTKINSFLCPSDNNPCNNDTGQFAGVMTQTGGFSNYPNNLGYNRTGLAGNGGQPWRPVGPAYFLGNDGSLNLTINLAGITDGTSNTMIFSEYVKGTAGAYTDPLGATFTGGGDFNLADHWVTTRRQPSCLCVHAGL